MTATINKETLQEAIEREEKEKLGVIRNVKFGVDDRGLVSLMFSVYMSEASVFDYYIWDMEQVQRVLLDANVRHVDSLNGMTCWYTTDVEGGWGGRCTFVRMFGAKH